eukprot:s8423_g2.t1
MYRQPVENEDSTGVHGKNTEPTSGVGGFLHSCTDGEANSSTRSMHQEAELKAAAEVHDPSLPGRDAERISSLDGCENKPHSAILQSGSAGLISECRKCAKKSMSPSMRLWGRGFFMAQWLMTQRRSHLRSLRSPCPRLELAGDAAGHAHADSCWFCSNLILPVHRHQELTLRKKDTRTAGFCRCAFLSGGSDRTRHP